MNIIYGSANLNLNLDQLRAVIAHMIDATWLTKHCWESQRLAKSALGQNTPSALKQNYSIHHSMQVTEYMHYGMISGQA